VETATKGGKKADHFKTAKTLGLLGRADEVIE
jgi:hypothetical protein